MEGHPFIRTKWHLPNSNSLLYPMVFPWNGCEHFQPLIPTENTLAPDTKNPDLDCCRVWASKKGGCLLCLAVPLLYGTLTKISSQAFYTAEVETLRYTHPNCLAEISWEKDSTHDESILKSTARPGAARRAQVWALRQPDDQTSPEMGCSCSCGGCWPNNSPSVMKT